MGRQHSVLEPLAIAVLSGGRRARVFLSSPTGGARRGALIAGGIALAGLVLNLLLIAGGVDDLITRNVLAIWMPAALFVAGGLAAARGTAGGAVSQPAFGLCAIGFVATALGVAFDREPPAARLARGGDERSVHTRRPERRGPAAASARSSSSTTGICCRCRCTSPGCTSWAPPARHVSAAGRRDGSTSPHERGILLVGVGLQPVAVEGAGLLPRRRVPRGSRRHELSSPSCVVASHPVKVTPADVSRALTATHLANDGLLIQR